MTLRRTALIALLFPTAAWPAAPSGRKLRIGYLSTGPGDLRMMKPLLAELGYVEGNNVTYESRVGPLADADHLAQELVATRPDLIVGVTNNSVAALQRATKRIPVVMMWVDAPVQRGFVKSLAQPGANITGATTLQELTWTKLAQTARALAPGAPAIGLLVAPQNESHQAVTTIVQAALAAEGGRLVLHPARDQQELDQAFAAAARAGIKVMLVAGGSPFASFPEDISRAGMKHRVGSAGVQASFVKGGGLFSYGMDADGHRRDVAASVDRIANGADPAMTPVAQPTLFQFLIHGRVARELGLAIPPALRVSAEILE
jgi:putative ABC transport system substrate-binding protein